MRNPIATDTPERAALLWGVVAFLFASARLFESGLSMDPAIYAGIARNLARGGDWWSLSDGKYFFPQFYEHPFLPFWLQGILFRLFGASDWSSRLLGVVLGPWSLAYLYLIARRLADERFAAIAAFLTVLTVPFIGRMATFYLEVPLVFFSLAAVLHALKGQSVLAGFLLGAAFLSKGLAALPIAALLGLVVLAETRRNPKRLVSGAVTLAIAAAVIAAFALLQAHNGSFSFWNHYITEGLFGKALRPGLKGADPLRYVFELVRLHPLHVLMALAAPIAVRRRPELRPVVLFGAAGTLLFGAATASLGKLHYHYFYPLFPFVNLLAAAPFAVFAPRLEKARWVTFALALGLVYQLVWNVLPMPQRRKPSADFFDLQPKIAALKESGVAELEGVSLTETEWVYPAMSLWYWDVDTRLLGDVAQADGPAVLTERQEDRAVLEGKGYAFCAGSSRFSLYVRGDALRDVCERAGSDMRRVR